MLVIDDNEVDQENVRRMLGDKYELLLAYSGEEGLRLAHSTTLDCVLLDHHLPDAEGLDLVPQLVKRQIPVVMLTGRGNEVVAVEAMKRGCQDYLNKEDLTKDSLTRSISHAIEKAKLNRTIRLQQEKLEQHAQELEGSNREFLMLAANVPARFCYIDADQRYRYINRRVEELYQLPEEEIIGKHAREVVGAEAYELLREYIEKALSGEQVSFEFTISFPRSNTRHVRGTYVPRFSEADGKVLGFYAVINDVTDLKEAEQRLVRSERLAAIGEAMTGLAHESRNILARIQASARMIARRITGDDDLLKLLDRIEKAQDDLHRLFEEVGRYAAPVKLNCEPAHLGNLLRETWEHLAPVREGRNAELLEVSGGVAPRCIVDTFFIRQVFRNILENALAACKDPMQIEVEYAEAQIGKKAALRIAMRDNGPGLTPKERGKVFDAFYTTKTHGTGLGLAIVKRIVDAHGGTITVGLGTVVRGAEFLITVPRRQT